MKMTKLGNLKNLNNKNITLAHWLVSLHGLDYGEPNESKNNHGVDEL